MFPGEGEFNREISLKLLPNPTNVSFLDSSKVKQTIATPGTITILNAISDQVLQTTTRFERSLTQREN